MNKACSRNSCKPCFITLFKNMVYRRKQSINRGYDDIRMSAGSPYGLSVGADAYIGYSLRVGVTLECVLLVAFKSVVEVRCLLQCVCHSVEASVSLGSVELGLAAVYGYLCLC